MNNVPLVTVIVPAYNAENFIEKCIVQLKNQTFNRWGCIIVNDGSSDHTSSKIKEGIKNDARFKIIEHDHNKGLSEARNTGLDNSNSKYVIFLDCDDIFNDRLLEALVDRAEKLKSQIVASNFMEHKIKKDFLFESMINFKLPRNNFIFLDEVKKKSNFEILSNVVWNKLYLRKYLIDNNFRFNSFLRRAEDLEFNIRVLSSSNRVSYVDEPLITYITELPNSNQSTISSYPEAIINSLDSIREYFSDNKILDKYSEELAILFCDHFTANMINYSYDALNIFLSEITKKTEIINIMESHEVYPEDKFRAAIIAAISSGKISDITDKIKLYLINEKNEFLKRIPPLEQRIKLELAEIDRLRRDNSKYIHPTWRLLLSMNYRYIRRAISSTLRN